MLGEDRRPVSQVPEDSVDPCMLHLFPSHPSPSLIDEPSILLPPYNLTDQFFFDSFAYIPSIAPEPTWANRQDPMLPSAIEFPHLTAIMQEPRFPPVSFPELSTMLDHSQNATLPSEWDAMMAFPDHCFANTDYCIFPEALPAVEVAFPDNSFANTEYCLFPETLPLVEAVEAGTAATSPAVEAAQEVTAAATSSPESSTSSVSPPATPRTPRQKKKPCPPPLPRASGFVPSNPDEFTPHERKRLYLNSLENYVHYLHSHFAVLNIAPMPLERVSSYPRMTCTSLRSMYLVLGSMVDTLHARIEEEENRFIQLQTLYAHLEHDLLFNSDTSSDSETIATSSSDTCIDKSAALDFILVSYSP